MPTSDIGVPMLKCWNSNDKANPTQTHWATEKFTKELWTLLIPEVSPRLKYTTENQYVGYAIRYDTVNEY